MPGCMGVAHVIWTRMEGDQLRPPRGKVRLFTLSKTQAMFDLQAAALEQEALLAVSQQSLLFAAVLVGETYLSRQVR